MTESSRSLIETLVWLQASRSVEVPAGWGKSCFLPKGKITLVPEVLSEAQTDILLEWTSFDAPSLEVFKTRLDGALGNLG